MYIKEIISFDYGVGLIFCQPTYDVTLYDSHLFTGEYGPNKAHLDKSLVDFDGTGFSNLDYAQIDLGGEGIREADISFAGQPEVRSCVIENKQVKFLSDYSLTTLWDDDDEWEEFGDDEYEDNNYYSGHTYEENIAEYVKEIYDIYYLTYIKRVFALMNLNGKEINRDRLFEIVDERAKEILNLKILPSFYTRVVKN